MKLSLVAQALPKRKIVTHFSGELMADVDLYASVLKEKTGKDVGVLRLMEAMLIDYLASDKEFQKLKNSRPTRTEHGPADNVTPTADDGSTHRTG